jgi:hypothetical protein
MADVSDFNGDGYADLAVGVPGEQLGTRFSAGGVEVIYGSAAGLTSRQSQFWTQDSPGVKGRADNGGAFGTTHTSGDFDGDGFADLAVGSPAMFGSVTVLYGSRTGLTARDQLFSPATLGETELWGSTLAAGDFDGDGHSDLAIGASPAPAGPQPLRGTLTVLRGSPLGLVTSGAVRVTPQSPGLSGTSAPGDIFAAHLAVGDVTGDGRDDLAFDSHPRSGEGGGVHFLAGSASGLTTDEARFFRSDDPAVVPADTKFSYLGFALAIADFDADGHADLALGDFDAGPPGDTDCMDRAACPGAVLVLPGARTGPTTAGKKLWYQDSPGVPGTSEGADAFGWALAAGDLNGDGRADLAVGALGEDLGSGERFDAGSATVLYGSATGLSAVGAQQWTQDSPGVKGAAEGSDYFGSSLRVLDFDRGESADLAVSSRGEGIGNDAEAAGGVNVLYGSGDGVTSRDQTWNQDTPGIAGSAERYDQFHVLGQ